MFKLRKPRTIEQSDRSIPLSIFVKEEFWDPAILQHIRMESETYSASLAILLSSEPTERQDLTFQELKHFSADLLRETSTFINYIISFISDTSAVATNSKKHFTASEL